MENCSFPEIWIEINSLFGFSIRYTAALKAYGLVFGDDQENRFLSLAHESLWRQLMSELSKIYDRALTCGKENCSIERLEKACEESPFLSSERRDEFTKNMENMRKRYEMLFPRELRNKKLAHYDRAAIRKQIVDDYCFDDIELFVRDTASLLDKIGSAVLPADITSRNYDGLARDFENSLLLLQERQNV